MPHNSTTLQRAALPKIPRVSLVDEVIAAMRTMLDEAAWSAGTKLPSEAELGRQLGVGRSTIREALRVLGHLGLVESRSGLGTYVVNRGMPSGRAEEAHTYADVQRFYEFREGVEVACARLAAERRSDAQMSAIQKAWAVCRHVATQGDPFVFAASDFRFHLSVVEASNNSYYVNSYKAIEATFVPLVGLILGLGPLSSMRTFHDDLIDAIDNGDGEIASQAASENFREIQIRLQLLTDGAQQTEDRRT